MARVFLFLLAICCAFGAMANSDPDREKYLITHSDAYKTAVKALSSKMSDVVNQHNDSVKGFDSCVENGKYANQFTIDRRCYVTPEQKIKHPYDAVVGITVNGWVSDYQTFESSAGTICTGVIIKNPNDGQLYIYTAAHCVSNVDGLEQRAYTQNGYVFPITNIVKQGGGATEFLTKDHAIFTIPQEYQHVLPYAETGDYTDRNVDIVGHGALAILSDSAIRAAKQEWTKTLKKPSEIQKNIFEQIRQYETYTDLIPHDRKLKVSFSCELLKENELNQSNVKKHNYCQGYGGNSGGPVFNFAGQVIGIVSWGKVNRPDDNRYAWFPYEGIKGVGVFNKDLQKYQEMSTKEPQNINNLKQIGGFNPSKEPDNK